jgi:hypothetical protein
MLLPSFLSAMVIQAYKISHCIDKYLLRWGRQPAKIQEQLSAVSDINSPERDSFSNHPGSGCFIPGRG